MLLYIFVALFPLIVGAAFNQSRVAELSMDEGQTERFYKRRWWWLFAAALPMFALIAFRGGSMGADTSSYLKFFSRMANTPWNKIFIINENGYQFEEGFVIFEKIMTLITDNPKIYQVIYSSIYLVSVVTFANRIEKRNFSFLFFFATIGLYTFMFTGVRQCLAMSILLWSYPYIKRRKLLPFLLILALAFTFHKSSILFIAAYFIYNRRLIWQNSILYAGFAALAYLNIGIIQEWFNDALDYDYGVESTGNGIIFFAVIAVITAFALFVVFYYKQQTPEFTGFINIGIIVLILWCLRLVTRVAERPSYYFMFFSAAMLCYAIEEIPNKRDKEIIGIFVYAAFMLLYVYKFLTGFASLVPYKTFF